MSQNFSQYFRALQILFFALLAGQILVAATVYMVYEPATLENPDAKLYIDLFGVFALAMAGLAFFLNRKKLETARQQTDMKQKLADYRTACILKWALIEGATIMSVVLFFVTGKTNFLGIASVLIVYFATQFPSRQRLVRELDLSVSERMMLDDPNAMVADTGRYQRFGG